MSTESERKPLKAVVYADGGCRPSRGIGGWGLHGYIYIDEPAKVGAGCKGGLPTPTGYRPGEGGKPTITIQKYIDGFGSLVPEVTNNYAEVEAAIQTLRLCLQNNVTSLLLIVDSQYVKQGIEEWSRNWAANHWIRNDGTPVPNAERWKVLLELKKEFEAGGGVIQCSWVKGHSEDFGNSLADRQATRGVICGRNVGVYEHIEISEPQGYWNPRYEKNRFFSHRNWYYTTQSLTGFAEQKDYHTYYLGDPGDEDEFTGKPISDATFSVLYLKHPEPSLEVVRQATHRAAINDYHGLMIGRLDRIFETTTMRDIVEHKDALFQQDKQRCRLFSPFDTILAEERRPAGLAFKAIDALEALERSLLEYLNPSDHSRYRVTDITDHFYETIVGKKSNTVKLRGDITSVTRSIKVNAQYNVSDNVTETTQLVLTVGQDLPDRNTLAAIAEEGIKVSVITWPESKEAIRFATVVEVGGNVGIWSGIYANLHLLES